VITYTEDKKCGRKGRTEAFAFRGVEPHGDLPPGLGLAGPIGFHATPIASIPLFTASYIHLRDGGHRLQVPGNKNTTHAREE